MKAVENRKKKWGPANPTNTNYKIMSGKMEKQKYIEFSESLKQFVITAKMSIRSRFAKNRIF